MKIELKKVKVNLTFSEETTMFKAELYADGKHIGYADNDGRGGSTNYYGTTKHYSPEIQKAEEYCKNLPEEEFNFGNGCIRKFPQSLESVIDKLVDQYVNAREQEKFQKKMQKAMLTGIVVGVPNSGSFGVYKLKSSTIANHPIPALQAWVNSINRKLGKDEKILNTNLPESVKVN